MGITPFCSVGVLVFGDSREVVRAKLDAEYSTFTKDVGENETDSFDSIGIHLYYDEEEKLEFVEAFNPAEITFRGLRFLGREVSSVTKEMEAIGFKSVVADAGIDFPAAGIALTAPSGTIEGIAAHRKGYYD